MKPASKAFAIITSVVIVVVCLIYAAVVSLPEGGFVSREVDKSGQAELDLAGRLEVKSTLSSITVTADPSASAVTARLHGSAVGLSLGGEPELIVERNGETVTVRAGRQGTILLGWSSSLRLDVVIPAGFAGEFTCESSAGAVSIDADLDLKSFRAHSSAGAVTARDITAEGDVELSSSAGRVQAGDVAAASADLHSSAGGVEVASCTAGEIRLNSSAGSVSAGALRGNAEVSSSAGSVEVTLTEVSAAADISSSAGRVTVTLPRSAGAGIEAWTSAGRVEVDGLDFSKTAVQKRNRIEATLGGGGPLVKAHSSAGSVELRGR